MQKNEVTPEELAMDPLAPWRHVNMGWKMAMRVGLCTRRIQECESALVKQCSVAKRHELERTLGWAREDLARLEQKHERSTATECTMLRAALYRADLSSYALSIRTGIGRTRICQYVLGEMIPKGTTLKRMLDACGVSPADLLLPEPENAVAV